MKMNSLNEPVTVNIHLHGLNSSFTGNKLDNLLVFCKEAIKNLKQQFGSSRIGKPEVIAVANVSNSRLLRLNSKVRDQLTGSESIIIITDQDWKHYTAAVLSHTESPMRHGKVLTPRHPGSLTHDQLAEFIKLYANISDYHLKDSVASKSTFGDDSVTLLSSKTPETHSESKPVQRKDLTDQSTQITNSLRIRGNNALDMSLKSPDHLNLLHGGNDIPINVDNQSQIGNIMSVESNGQTNSPSTLRKNKLDIDSSKYPIVSPVVIQDTVNPTSNTIGRIDWSESETDTLQLKDHSFNTKFSLYVEESNIISAPSTNVKKSSSSEEDEDDNISVRIPALNNANAARRKLSKDFGSYSPIGQDSKMDATFFQSPLASPNYSSAMTPRKFSSPRSSPLFPSTPRSTSRDVSPSPPKLLPPSTSARSSIKASPTESIMNLLSSNFTRPLPRSLPPSPNQADQKFNHQRRMSEGSNSEGISISPRLDRKYVETEQSELIVNVDDQLDTKKGRSGSPTDNTSNILPSNAIEVSSRLLTDLNHQPTLNSNVNSIATQQFSDDKHQESSLLVKIPMPQRNENLETYNSAATVFAALESGLSKIDNLIPSTNDSAGQSFILSSSGESETSSMYSDDEFGGQSKNNPKESVIVDMSSLSATAHQTLPIPLEQEIDEKHKVSEATQSQDISTVERTSVTSSLIVTPSANEINMKESPLSIQTNMIQVMKQPSDIKLISHNELNERSDSSSQSSSDESSPGAEKSPFSIGASLPFEEHPSLTFDLDTSIEPIDDILKSPYLDLQSDDDVFEAENESSIQSETLNTIPAIAAAVAGIQSDSCIPMDEVFEIAQSNDSSKLKLPFNDLNIKTNDMFSPRNLLDDISTATTPFPMMVTNRDDSEDIKDIKQQNQNVSVESKLTIHEEDNCKATSTSAEAVNRIDTNGLTPSLEVDVQYEETDSMEGDLFIDESMEYSSFEKYYLPFLVPCIFSSVNGGILVNRSTGNQKNSPSPKEDDKAIFPSPLSGSMTSLVDDTSTPISSKSPNPQSLSPAKSHLAAIFPISAILIHSNIKAIRRLKKWINQVLVKANDDHVLLWGMFNTYGTIEGLLVKSIKSIQMQRLLKDCSIPNVSQTRLDMVIASSASSMSSDRNQCLSKNGISSQSSISSVGMTSRTRAMIASMSSNHSSQSAASVTASISFDRFCMIMATLERSKDSPQTISSPHFITESNQTIRRGKWMELCFNHMKSKFPIYSTLLDEVKESLSGVLRRTCYDRYLSSLWTMYKKTKTIAKEQPIRSPSSLNTKKASNETPIPSYDNIRLSDDDLESVRHLWDLNIESIRRIFVYFSSNSQEPRRVLPSNRNSSSSSQCLLNNTSLINSSLLSFNQCRELTMLFGIVPQIVDHQGLLRIFRSVKLWEWLIVEAISHHSSSHQRSPISSINKSPTSEIGGGSTHLSGYRGGLFDMESVKSSISKKHQSTYSSRRDGSSNDQDIDPYDFYASYGNFGITLCGFVELLTRIACLGGVLGATPYTCVRYLLRIMDMSEAKSKLSKEWRKGGPPIGNFTY